MSEFVLDTKYENEFLNRYTRKTVTYTLPQLDNFVTRVLISCLADTMGVVVDAPTIRCILDNIFCDIESEFVHYERKRNDDKE